MRNLDLCYALVKATCEATNLPVSIKIRSRIHCEQKADPEACHAEVTAVDLVERLKDLPIAALMIHGRSYEKPFDGEPDVAMITRVREIAPCPVIANGGIYTPEDARTMLDDTHAHGIGIGRGSHGSPWIFQQIKEFFATGSYTAFTWEEKKHVIRRHAQLAFSANGTHGLVEMRKHLAWYVKGIYNAGEIRQMLVQTKCLQDVDAALAGI